MTQNDLRLLTNTRSLVGKKCSKCGVKLSSNYQISMLKDAALLCDSCARCPENENRIAVNYIVRDNIATPLLDPASFNIMQTELSRPTICTNVTRKHGQIPITVPENNSIVIRGVENETPLQREYTARPSLFAQESRQFNDSGVDLIKMHSGFNRRLIRIKGGTPEQVKQRLDSLGTLLANLAEQTSVRIFAEKLNFDTEDKMLEVLARSGYICEYYDGAAEKKTKPKEKDKSFDFTMPDLYNYCKSRVIGQDEELKTLCYLIMEHLNRYSINAPDSSTSCVLTAPSGGGKTEFYKAVEAFFREHNVPVPVLRIDLSQITETGWKGKEITSVITQIHEASKNSNGFAICFLDEADKRMVPSIGSSGTNYNAAMQANLLTMVEGSLMEDSENEMFDTSHTMFIMMGAFQRLRDEKREYGEMLDEIYSDDSNCKQKADEQFYANITMKEIVDYGMIEELAGRLKMVINFHMLPEDAMREVIVQKCELLAEQFRCDLRITDEAIEEFLGIAYTSLGIRQPMNTMSEMLIRKLAEVELSKEFDRETAQFIIEGLAKITVQNPVCDKPEFFDV